MNDPTTDQLFLLNGISKEILSKGCRAINLTVHGRAFPLLHNATTGSIEAAGSRHGSTKIILLGCSSGSEYHLLISNAMQWLTMGKPSPSFGIISSDKFQTLSGCLKDAKAACSAEDTLKLDCLIIEEFVAPSANRDVIKFALEGGTNVLLLGKTCSQSPEIVNEIVNRFGIEIHSKVKEEVKVYAKCSLKPSRSSDFILQNIQKLLFGNGIPSKLIPYGETAFSIIEDINHGVIVAGSHWKAGRVVHYGHESYPAARKDDTLKFNENIFKWLCSEKNNNLFGIYGSKMNPIHDAISDCGFDVRRVTKDDDFTVLSAVVVSSFMEYSPEESKKFKDFVEAGGGLLSCGHNWYHKRSWASNLMDSFGINVTKATGKSDVSILCANQRPLLNCTNAITAVKDHQVGRFVLDHDSQLVAFTSVCNANTTLTYPTYPFHRLLSEYIECATPVIPSKSEPIMIKNQPLEALFLSLSDSSHFNHLPHPAAVTFPGTVPSNLYPLTKTITIDASFGGLDDQFPGNAIAVWRRTGVYAKPGAVLTVTSPDGCTDRGLQILIGCHTDKLYKKEKLSRCPNISRKFPLASGNTLVSNPFGGIVYILVPKGIDLGSITLTIEGGFEVPEYVHGKTSVDDWMKILSMDTVPFCELICKNLILTVPTYMARKYANHVFEVMQVYQDAMEGMLVLSGINVNRSRKERIVLDVQISNGAFHAGYPIMGHTSSAESMLSIDSIKTKGLWGPFHELGHQLQSKGWNCPNTTEATCNIFSVFCSEEILGIPRGKAHRALVMEKRKERIASYVNGGKDFQTSWRVWTALETYLQLQEAFGWQFIRDMLQYYNQTPSPIEKGSTCQVVIDEWVIKSCKVVGFNLGPFYKSWGWPVSSHIMKLVRPYPRWVNDPMVEWTGNNTFVQQIH